MKNRKIYAAITLLCFLLTLMPVTVFAADEVTVVDSGTCGDNATWKLTSDGVLTISGSGTMEEDYAWGSAPWYAIKEIIIKVIIEDGITSIGNNTFRSCSRLESITTLLKIVVD